MERVACAVVRSRPLLASAINVRVSAQMEVAVGGVYANTQQESRRVLGREFLNKLEICMVGLAIFQDARVAYRWVTDLLKSGADWRRSPLPIVLMTACLSSCYNMYLPSTPLAPLLSSQRQNVLGVSVGPAYGVDIKGANFILPSTGLYYSGSYRPKLGKGTTLSNATADAGLLWSLGPSFEAIAGAGLGQNVLHEQGSEPRSFDSPYPGFEDRSISYSKAFAQIDLRLVKSAHSELSLAARVERGHYEQTATWIRDVNDSSTRGALNVPGWATTAFIWADARTQIAGSSTVLVGSLGPIITLASPFSGFNSSWILSFGAEWSF